jgi:hypothetical protein
MFSKGVSCEKFLDIVGGTIKADNPNLYSGNVPSEITLIPF